MGILTALTPISLSITLPVRLDFTPTVFTFLRQTNGAVWSAAVKPWQVFPAATGGGYST